MAQPAPFSNVESEEDIAQRRKLAMALMGQASDTSPVGHWTGALARAVQGGMSQWGQQEAKGAEKARKDALAQALMGSQDFAKLGDTDRAIIAQNPALMQSLAGKVYGNKLDPNAGKTDDMKNFEYSKANPGFVDFKNKVGAAGYGKAGAIFQNPDGTYSAVQFGERGDLKVHPLGKGVEPAKGVKQVGDEIVSVASGNTVRNVGQQLQAEAVNKGVGQATAKTIAELPEAKLRTNTVVGALSRLRQTAESLEAQPGLDKVVGGLYQAYAPNVSTGSRNAATELENLKVKISGVVLQSMRDASKTGGAVGQVTEREWPRLENMIANLDPSQGIDQFKKNLRSVVQYANDVEAMIKEAYAADLKVAQGGQALIQREQPAAAPTPAGGVDLKAKYGLE